MGKRDPDNHCALNVALYGPGARRWTMTERPRRSCWRSADTLAIGPSALRWDGDSLLIDIAEISAPIPQRVRGTVRIYPELLSGTAFALDREARHRWHPVAPRGRVEVDLVHPDLRWRGSGYFDSNFGDEPLEAGFAEWHWSRAHLRDDVAIFYEGRRKDGTPFDLAMRFDRQGCWRDAEQPPLARLPRTLWQMQRMTRADAGHAPAVIKTWEDAPFYARSALRTRLYGENVDAVHESLSLTRLDSPVVRQMLPYRMPRAFR